MIGYVFARRYRVAVSYTHLPGETSICAASMAARNDGTNAGGIIMEKRKRRIKILVMLTAAALLFAAVAQAATTLGWGSTGTDVRRVQQLLRQWRCV